MTGLRFGTSGLRGLATELAGGEARRYAAAFMSYLSGIEEGAETVYFGRDLRASSEAIFRDCAAAVAAMGVSAVDCGVLPTPALAFHAMAAGAPSIMITGSHIPANRNGLKFFRANGEISKLDEAGIRDHLRDAEPGDYTSIIADAREQAHSRYVKRYQGILGPETLRGQRIGVFEHATSGRQALVEIFAAAGADIVRLGLAEEFVAIDTEAFADDVFAPLPAWIRQHNLAAIISADGDADRPLLMDDQARFVRGDVLALLAARFFGADTVVTPITSNTAIEATEYFDAVIRTKVGSPYVIEGIDAALVGGGIRVVGFEANGGTLLGSDFTIGQKQLPALMTRDAILPLIGVFGQAARENCAISRLVKDLPIRVALSDRLENVSAQQSLALLESLIQQPAAGHFFRERGVLLRMEQVDGLQFFLDDNTMIHYRASGNAPELRCYVEANTQIGAEKVLQWALLAAKQAMAIA